MVFRWRYVVFYLWSNQGIIMLSTYASRTVHLCWWLSDYYYMEKTTSALWGTWHIIMSRQIAASLLSLCMTKWLRKWRRGWCYVRSNTKNAKSLLCCYSHTLNRAHVVFACCHKSTFVVHSENPFVMSNLTTGNSVRTTVNVTQIPACRKNGGLGFDPHGNYATHALICAYFLELHSGSIPPEHTSLNSLQTFAVFYSLQPPTLSILIFLSYCTNHSDTFDHLWLGNLWLFCSFLWL